MFVDALFGIDFDRAEQGLNRRLITTDRSAGRDSKSISPTMYRVRSLQSEPRASFTAVALGAMGHRSSE